MMTPMVLDYSEAISSNRFFPNPDGPASVLFRDPGWCPYCKKKAGTVFDNTESLRYGMQPDIRVWECTCGWWDIRREENCDADGFWTGGPTGMVAVLDPIQPSPTVRHAILKSYRASDQSLPILALRKELVHRGDLLHHIHPRKLEQLVASVLSDFYGNCKATVCGRSGDGGIDVILVESNRPIAIQVKRRERPDKSERVSCIREFIAAMQLNDYYEGMYVTTAENFSSAASRETELAVEKRLIMKCELIDKGRLLDMIGATSRNPIRPWKKHLEQVLAW